MARLTAPAWLSLAVVALVICASAAHVDGTRCSAGYGTCTYGRTCKTNLWSDRNNCGRCGSKCECGPHSTSQCTKGKCSFQCDKVHGWSDCDGNHLNGCETNVHTDKRNCGRCRYTCPAPRNSVASCDHGVCRKSCLHGYSPCGSSCVKLSSDVWNCGKCGKVCPVVANGRASCVGGACATACSAGLSRCSGKCVKLLTDVKNCGNAGTVCPTKAGATATCAGGTCGLKCNSGLTNCHGKCVRLSSDPQNCRECGKACPGALLGDGICVAGTCGVNCEEGLTLCNGQCYKLDVNLNNCGTCGNVCTVAADRAGDTAPICRNGVCGSVTVG